MNRPICRADRLCSGHEQGKGTDRRVISKSLGGGCHTCTPTCSGGRGWWSLRPRSDPGEHGTFFRILLSAHPSPGQIPCPLLPHIPSTYPSGHSHCTAAWESPGVLASWASPQGQDLLRKQITGDPATCDSSTQQSLVVCHYFRE